MAKVADLYAEIRGDSSSLKGALKDSASAMKQFQDQLTRSGLASGQTFDEFMSTQHGAIQLGKGVSGAAFSLIAFNQALELTKKVIRGAKQAWDFAAEGAQMASLESASYKLAKNFGMNMDEVVGKIKVASFDTISEYDAIKSANLAMTMGVAKNADDVANLLQIAIARGRAFGLTTQEAFEKIVIGIGRNTPKVLDDLGFAVQGAGTSQEKLNAVLKQGNAELEKMGGLQIDVATGYQRIEAARKDIVAGIGRGIGEAFSFIGLSGEERGQVLREETQLLMERSKNYEEFSNKYLQMRNRLVGAGREKEFGFASVSEEEFSTYKFQMLSTKQGLDDLTNQTIYFTDAAALQIALTGDLGKVFASYSAGIENAKGNLEVMGAVTQAANESLQDYAYNLLTSNMDLQTHGEFVLNAALHFGKMTQAEFEAARAGQELQDYIKDNNLTWEQSKPLVDAYNQGLEQMMKGGRSDYFIYIHYVTTGGAARGQYTNISKDVNLWNLPAKPTGFIHGGAIRAQHGLMVSPGFSNDGGLVRVSSGEKLSVEPAGNKDIVDEPQWARNILYAIEKLPTAMKEAVQQVV